MFSLKRGAVQGHERLVLPRAVLVDRLGDQFLAGAGLALDEHAGVGRGDAFEPLDDVAHLRAVADDALEAELLVQPPLQLDVGPPQPRALDRLLRARAKLVDVQRLQQVVEGPLAHRLDGRRHRAVAGQQDDLGVGLVGLRPGEDAQAVDVVHHQVGDDDVEVLLLDDAGRLAAGGGHAAAEADPLEALGHGLGVGPVVVDDQHLGWGRRRASAPPSAVEWATGDAGVILLMITHAGTLTSPSARRNRQVSGTRRVPGAAA